MAGGNQSVFDADEVEDKDKDVGFTEMSIY